MAVGQAWRPFFQLAKTMLAYVMPMCLYVPICAYTCLYIGLLVADVSLLAIYESGNFAYFQNARQSPEKYPIESCRLEVGRLSRVMKLSVTLLLLFAVIAAFICSAAEVAESGAVAAEEAQTPAATEPSEEGKKSKKPVKVGPEKWKGIKAEDIEKDWEQGDSTDELESEHDRLEKIRAKKRPQFDINDKESLKRAYKKDPSTFGTGEGQAGQAMVFVEIKKDPKTGEPRSVDEIRKIASRWTSMLQAGGLLVQLYHPGDSTILFHVERGWLIKQVMKFAAEQKEVDTLTLNQKKFTRKEYLQSIEDDEDL
jgi:hypothetical protein